MHYRRRQQPVINVNNGIEGPPEPGFFDKLKSQAKGFFDFPPINRDTIRDEMITSTHTTFDNAAILVKPIKAVGSKVGSSLRSAFVPLAAGAVVVLFLVFVTRNFAAKVTS